MSDDKPLSDGSVIYKFVLVAPNGEQVTHKRIRIYPFSREDNELMGHLKGFELARDAMFHAGFWENEEKKAG